MKLSKFSAYLLFVCAILVILLCYQGVWLFSKATHGEILNFGHGSGKGYKHIENVRIQYAVDNKIYEDTYLRNGLKDTTRQIAIRYLLFAPSISRVDTFIGNWGFFVVVFVIAILCISIFFLIQDIIPNGSVFIVSRAYPFVLLKKPEGRRDPNDQYAW